MNTVKRWLAGFLSFAMIFTSAAFTNLGALAVYAFDTSATVTITSKAGNEFVYDGLTTYNDFASAMNNASAGDTVKIEGQVGLNDTNNYIFSTTLNDNNDIITVDLTEASFLGSDGMAKTIVAGGNLCMQEDEDTANVFRFSNKYYEESNCVINFPKEYNSDKTNRYGVTASFTMANGYVDEIKEYVAEDSLAAGKFALTVVNTNKTDPTCTEDGEVELKATLYGYSGTEKVKIKESSFNYGKIIALGHKYGTVNNGVITLPSYQLPNPTTYVGYGVRIAWAIRGSGPNIIASKGADGNTIIESIQTKCINDEHEWGLVTDENEKWQDATVTSIAAEAGSAATSSAAGSTRYTLKITTADGVDIVVRQTVYDIPGTEATDISIVTKVGFETKKYKHDDAKNEYEEDSTIADADKYQNVIYADYTQDTQDTTVYWKTVIAENGDLNYRVDYLDNAGVAGHYVDTLHASTEGDYKSKTYACGANTFYYAPIKIRMIDDSGQTGSTAFVYIGGRGYSQGNNDDRTPTRDLGNGNSLFGNTYKNVSNFYKTTGSAKTYLVAEFAGNHTLEMSDGTTKITKAATSWETGSATITCKYCGNTANVVLPINPEGALYELTDGTVKDADLLANETDKKKNYTEPATCEKEGFSYLWSVNITALCEGDDQNNVDDNFVKATVANPNFEKTDLEAGMFWKEADDKYHYIYDSEVSTYKNDDLKTKDSFYVLPAKTLGAPSQGSTTKKHWWAGVISKIDNTETDALGHDYKVTNVAWSINENYPVAGPFTEAELKCTVTYTCKHNGKSGTTCETPSKIVTYYYRSGTNVTGTTNDESYNAITKIKVAGADCSENDRTVYTVKDVKDADGDDIKYSKDETTYSNHDFDDQVNWSDDGKKATVKRTCKNVDCMNRAEGNYHKNPLVVTATVTKEDQDDGSYLYTAKLGDEVVGTKKVFDLNDATVTVNGGEPVDNNLYPGSFGYDWDNKQPAAYNNFNPALVTAKNLPEFEVAINGITIDPELYTFQEKSYEESGKVASFVLQNTADTEAYGTAKAKYKILKNKMFSGYGAYKVDNQDEVTFNATTVIKTTSIVVDNETHKLEVVAADDKETGKDIIKKTTVKYAIVPWVNGAAQVIDTDDVKKLTYGDSAGFKELGQYDVYAEFSADGYTTEYTGKIASVKITKANLKKVYVYIDNASVIEGNTPNLHVRVVSAFGEDAGKTLDVDQADFTIKTVGGEDLTNLKVGTYQLIATSEVYDVEWDSNQSKAGYMGTLTVLAKDSSTPEEQAAAESVTALINALNDNSTAEEVAAARKAYDALTDTAKARVDADVLKKLTDAEEKVATDAVIDQFKKATTDAEKAAAYEAYSKLNDNQKKAVEAAVTKDTIDAAKAAADKKNAEKDLADAKAAANNALAGAKGYESDAEVAKAITALNDAIAKNDAAAIKTATTALNNAVAAAKKATPKASTVKLSKTKYTIKRGKSAKIKYKKTGNGKVTFKKKSGKSFITVSKGKIKVKNNKAAKNAKGKTFKIKVTIKEAATSTYKAYSATKTIKVKIK